MVKMNITFHKDNTFTGSTVTDLFTMIEDLTLFKEKETRLFDFSDKIWDSVTSKALIKDSECGGQWIVTGKSTEVNLKGENQKQPVISHCMGDVSHMKYLISLLAFKEAVTVNTEAAMMTAIDSNSTRLRLPAERQSVTLPTASTLEVSHGCFFPPSPSSEWADRTQRKIIPLVLIRLFNYGEEMLFTETCTEDTDNPTQRGCCTFTAPCTLKSINDPFAEIQGSLGGDCERSKRSELKLGNKERKSLHFTSAFRVPFCTSRSGMVKPVTSLPCDEKNLLALPCISSKPNSQSVSQTDAQTAHKNSLIHEQRCNSLSFASSSLFLLPCRQITDGHSSGQTTTFAYRTDHFSLTCHASSL
ncbi:Hypothetical predicted protein [Scomber scombrus]|uniref:Uncharacterized protein n=1 Tax=Scomber scombrus TaxID=13677 RepID=A0AAV1P683_SCOSC